MNPWTFKWLTEISPKYVEKVVDTYTKKNKAISWDKLMQMDRVETLASLRRPKLKEMKLKKFMPKTLKRLLFNTQ
jgi:hypothetical protein